MHQNRLKLPCVNLQIDTRQGHETINFGGQEVNDQANRRPKIDLEAWQSRHSRPPLGRVAFLILVV